MNEHRQYVFIRKYENEVLLVLVNFDNMPVHLSVNIPYHAFEYLQIPEYKTVQATDLLSGKPKLSHSRVISLLLLTYRNGVVRFLK